MTEEQVSRIEKAVQQHGDQLMGNIVQLKRFLERLQNEQQAFLTEQRAASDRAQNKAHWSAIFSAVAAGSAALPA